MNSEVFILYSWESEEHKEKVLEFYREVRDAGFDCDIDRAMSQRETAIDFYRMMHNAIVSSKKIIIVLSKDYKSKADSFIGGVGEEYGLIIKEINEQKRKYILVAFEKHGSFEVPIYFKGREIIHFDENNNESKHKLYAKLQDIDEIEIPEIGKTKPKILTKKISKLKFLPKGAIEKSDKKTCYLCGEKKRFMSSRTFFKCLGKHCEAHEKTVCDRCLNNLGTRTSIFFDDPCPVCKYGKLVNI